MPVNPAKPASDTSAQDLANGLIYCQAEDLFALKPLGQKLQLEQTRTSHSMMAGVIRTRYKGRGMSFAEVRPYQAGDDIRTIDWRVTARTQTPYTKLFEEERERPVYLLIDMRSSMFFGSQHQFKCVYAARMATAIAWAALAKGDNIGAMILSDHGEWDLRPKRGKNAVLALINALVEANQRLSNPAAPSGRSLQGFLDDAKRIVRPGAKVYVLSDAHDHAEGNINSVLCTLARHADITFIHIYDTLEAQLPSKGWFSVSDGFERTQVNGRTISQRFKDHFTASQAAIAGALTQSMSLGLSAPVGPDLEGWLIDTFGKGRTKRKSAPTMTTANRTEAK
ncbi:MAG: DUF58 domain-containing protein [Marinagarivorans sp.]|nr:DUF58 domain-containing protein [Marinagarivorans sp.]